MDLKVAIVGLSPSSRDRAPWGDHAWEKWGLPWDGYWARYDRLFEMHDVRWLRTRPIDYLDRLNDCGRLYMDGSHADFPDATPYPFEAVADCIGPAYFNSSVAYMLALAITEGAQEISLFGVDMGDDSEYAYQRANCEYLIGMARGKGITVHIPDDSPVCKFTPTGFEMNGQAMFDQQRYGWIG